MRIFYEHSPIIIGSYGPSDIVHHEHGGLISLGNHQDQACTKLTVHIDGETLSRWLLASPSTIEEIFRRNAHFISVHKCGTDGVRSEARLLADNILEVNTDLSSNESRMIALNNKANIQIAGEDEKLESDPLARFRRQVPVFLCGTDLENLKINYAAYAQQKRIRARPEGWMCTTGSGSLLAPRNG